MNDFWQRLKQRKIVQWAVAWVAFAFALLQGIDIIAQRFDWPPAIERYLILALIVGFFVVLVLAWYHGERGAQRIGGTELVIIALLLAVGGGLIWRFGPATVRRAQAPTVAAAASSTGQTAIAAQPIPAKSIAVLPFENLSGDKNNAYFVAGMQDLILTKLADIGDLKVIARTSTQAYGSHPQNLKVVGRQLGVATILEGSVQKQGNEVLINVQLINAQTAAHLWARAYTRTLTNVFGVEGEVATKIATSLNARLSPAQAAQLAAAPSANQAAMDLFLRAEYQANKASTNYSTGDFSGFRAAIPLYRQAIATDPGFALAYARLSYVESHMAYITGENAVTLTAQARADAEAAQKLAPHAVATLLALGYCDYYGKGDYVAALETFKAALSVRPNDSATLTAIGYVERKQNNYDDALASLQRAFALDPRNSALASEIGSTYMMVSRFSEAKNWFQRALALDPTNLNAKSSYPYAILFGSGDVARALAAAGGDDPTMQSTRGGLFIYQRQYAKTLALLDAEPDTPDNFALVRGQSKALQQADLYRLLGDVAKARPLYRQALTALRTQRVKSEQTRNIYLAEVWNAIADAELGLGQTKVALAAIASAQAANVKFKARHPLVFAYVMQLNASLYAQARRPDLAVPLLARALSLPAMGWNYSPVLLWLDPAWDPIRHDPRFQALLQKYAKDKPAVVYPIPAAAAGTSAP